MPQPTLSDLYDLVRPLGFVLDPVPPDVFAALTHALYVFAFDVPRDFANDEKSLSWARGLVDEIDRHFSIPPSALAIVLAAEVYAGNNRTKEVIITRNLYDALVRVYDAVRDHFGDALRVPFRPHSIVELNEFRGWTVALAYITDARLSADFHKYCDEVVGGRIAERARRKDRIRSRTIYRGRRKRSPEP